jgi:hypothetical protein
MQVLCRALRDSVFDASLSTYKNIGQGRLVGLLEQLYSQLIITETLMDRRVVRVYRGQVLQDSRLVSRVLAISLKSR